MSEKPGRPALRLENGGGSDTDDTSRVQRGRAPASRAHPKGVLLFSAERRDGSDLLQCFMFSADPAEIHAARQVLEDVVRKLDR